MSGRISVLVADDEPLARDGLARLVSRLDGCDVVGQAANASAATEMCLRLRPDVLLLDIEMPGDDGFAVLRALPRAETPYTVLVTAFEQYALGAFDHGVRDYVLKPVETSRLRAALLKAGDAIRERRLAKLGEQVRSLSASNAEPVRASGDARLVVRDSGRLRVVPLERVEWIEADGYHARVHAGAKSYLMRESLDSLAERLPGAFVRAHRSSILHLAFVSEVRARRDGSFIATLSGGAEVEVSRRRVAAVRSALRATEV